MSRSKASSSLYLLAGAFAALGRPGIELWPCYFVGLGALFYGVVRAATHGVALARALCFAVALGAVMGIGGVSWGPPVPLLIAFTVIATLIVPLAALARVASRLFEPLPAAVFVGSGWSVVCFVFASAGVPCYLAVTAAMPAAATLLGGVRLVGVALIDGALVAACFAVAHRLSLGSLASRSTWLLAARAGAVPVAASIAGTLLARANAQPSSGRLSAGIVQVNADSGFYESRLESPELVKAFDQQLEGLLRGAAGTDLVALPEAFDGRYGLLLPSLVERWSALARTRRQAVLVTSYLPEASGQKSNAAGVFDREGRLAGVHRKVVLAPYGERDLAKGSSYETYEVLPSVRLGVLICQESMAGGAVSELVLGGASLLVATTSDLTFGSSVLAFEHLAATRVRAIEAGRSVIWASNGGPSGVIDRFGGVDRLGPFRHAVTVRVDAELFYGSTPYLRLRWVWFAFQCLVVAACVAFAKRPWKEGEFSRDDEPRSKRVGITRAAAIVVASVLLTLAFIAASPAIVEWRKGSSERALLAVSDLFSAKQRFRASDPLSGFRGTDPERAAVAYFLGYYGDPRRALDFPEAAEKGLSGAERLLREHVGLATRPYDLSGRLPRIAGLVELKDGSLGVVASPSDGTAWLFRAKEGDVLEGTSSVISALLGTRCLLPVRGP